jgi:hypothetical protein
MKNYEEIKAFLSENKNSFVLGACFVLVFLVGFGTGGYVKESRPYIPKSISNYTTQIAKTPTVLGANTAVKGIVATSTPDAKCLIKGNISTAGKKIYHITGGAFYAKVHPEQCFNTEADAVAAGFVKSSR